MISENNFYLVGKGTEKETLGLANFLMNNWYIRRTMLANTLDINSIDDFYNFNEKALYLYSIKTNKSIKIKQKDADKSFTINKDTELLMVSSGDSIVSRNVARTLCERYANFVNTNVTCVDINEIKYEFDESKGYSITQNFNAKIRENYLQIWEEADKKEFIQFLPAIRNLRKEFDFPIIIYSKFDPASTLFLEVLKSNFDRVYMSVSCPQEVYEKLKTEKDNNAETLSKAEISENAAVLNRMKYSLFVPSEYSNEREKSNGNIEFDGISMNAIDDDENNAPPMPQKLVDALKLTNIKRSRNLDFFRFYM